jgi:type II secretory pathway component GspD/PulD (secretin)
MIEVTLLLSQNSRTRGAGINLLDGLTVQFSGQRTTQQVSAPVNSVTQTLTSALSIPQINYSLNLFNTREDYYEVVAHPSLVATIGQTSEFFIGRTIVVGVSGVNLGSLQPIDIGTSVKVTPYEVTPQRARFRVDAARSFFAAQTGGSTFQQQLTTFKQSVDATVDVEFGKTMILSGLYEGVSVGESSKVPGLGDVPIVNTFFKSRDHTSRQDAALILVTPRLPGSIDTGTRELRGETLERLLDLWKTVVDPTSNLDATLRVLERKTRSLRGLKGDVRMPPANDPHVVASMLDDTLRRLQ